LDWSGGNLFSSDYGNTGYRHNGFSTTILNTVGGASSTNEWRGIAFDGSNVIGVHDSPSDEIVHYSGYTSTPITRFGSPASRPTGCAWDGTDLYTMDFGTKLIYHHNGITSSLAGSYAAPSETGSTNPVGLSLYDSSSLIVLVQGVNKVYRINKSTGAQISSVDLAATLGTSTEMYGCAWDGSNLYVAVNVAAPIADFSGSPQTGYASLTVDFTDLSTNIPTGWSWTFESGSPGVSSSQHPQDIVFSSAGTYNVTLTASNSGGSDDETKLDYIIVYEAVTDTLDGQIAIYDGATNTFNGQVVVQDTLIDKFNGQARIYSVTVDKFNGVIWIYDTDIDKFDGTAHVHKDASRLFNSWMRIFSTTEVLFDGSIWVVLTSETYFDGSVSIVETEKDNLDGTIFLFSTIITLCSGRVRIYNTAEASFDGHVYIVESFQIAGNGEIFIFSTDTSLCDGHLLIFDTEQIALDGRVDIAFIDFFDAHVQVGGKPGSEMFFGQVRIRQDRVFVSQFKYLSLFQDDSAVSLPRAQPPEV